MEKYDNIVKSSEIRKLVDKKMYQKALVILNTMDLDKVKILTDLSVFAEVYMRTGHFEEAKELLLKLKEKTSSRRVINQLLKLSLQMKDVDEAEKYYDEYIKIAPNDAQRFVLRYQIDRLKHEDISVLIHSLEELKENEYIEKWAYELAKLYHKAGLKDKCVRECSDIILWFGEGVIVEKAKLLRQLYIGAPRHIQAIRVDRMKDIAQQQDLYKTKDLSMVVQEVKQYLNENPLEDEMQNDLDNVLPKESIEKQEEEDDTKVYSIKGKSAPISEAKEELEESYEEAKEEAMYNQQEEVSGLAQQSVPKIDNMPIEELEQKLEISIDNDYSRDHTEEENRENNNNLLKEEEFDEGVGMSNMAEHVQQQSFVLGENNADESESAEMLYHGAEGGIPGQYATSEEGNGFIMRGANDENGFVTNDAANGFIMSGMPDSEYGIGQEENQLQYNSSTIGEQENFASVNEEVTEKMFESDLDTPESSYIQERTETGYIKNSDTVESEYIPEETLQENSYITDEEVAETSYAQNDGLEENETLESGFTTKEAEYIQNNCSESNGYIGENKSIENNYIPEQTMEHHSFATREDEIGTETISGVTENETNYMEENKSNDSEFATEPKISKKEFIAKIASAVSSPNFMRSSEKQENNFMEENEHLEENFMSDKTTDGQYMESTMLNNSYPENNETTKNSFLSNQGDANTNYIGNDVESTPTFGQAESNNNYISNENDNENSQNYMQSNVDLASSYEPNKVDSYGNYESQNQENQEFNFIYDDVNGQNKSFIVDDAVNEYLDSEHIDNNEFEQYGRVEVKNSETDFEKNQGQYQSMNEFAFQDSLSGATNENVNKEQNKNYFGGEQIQDNLQNSDYSKVAQEPTMTSSQNNKVESNSKEKELETITNEISNVGTSESTVLKDEKQQNKAQITDKQQVGSGEQVGVNEYYGNNEYGYQHDTIHPGMNSIDPATLETLRREARENYSAAYGNAITKDIFAYTYFAPETALQIDQCFDIALKLKESVNLAIMGPVKSGKTTLGRMMVQVMHQLRLLDTSQVAKINANKLNSINLSSKYDKLTGGTIIIEQASQLSRYGVNQLDLLLDDMLGEVTVILEDAQGRLEMFFQNNEKIADSFTEQIKIPTYGVEELTAFAKSYVLRKDYLLTPEAKQCLEVVAKQIGTSVVSMNRFVSIINVMNLVIRKANQRPPYVDMRGNQVRVLFPDDFKYS